MISPDDKTVPQAIDEHRKGKGDQFPLTFSTVEPLPDVELFWAWDDAAETNQVAHFLPHEYALREFARWDGAPLLDFVQSWLSKEQKHAAWNAALVHVIDAFAVTTATIAILDGKPPSAAWVDTAFTHAAANAVGFGALIEADARAAEFAVGASHGGSGWSMYASALAGLVGGVPLVRFVGWLPGTRVSTGSKINFPEAIGVQVYNLMLDELPWRLLDETGVGYRTCENCAKRFLRQDGGSRHGQHRTRGVVRFCSIRCSNAAAARRKRAKLRDAKAEGAGEA